LTWRGDCCEGSGEGDALLFGGLDVLLVAAVPLAVPGGMRVAAILSPVMVKCFCRRAAANTLVTSAASKWPAATAELLAWQAVAAAHSRLG